MSTRLEELIESIDPSRTIERVSEAVDEAFNSFEYDNPINSFEDYKKYMSKYVQHVEQIVLKFRSNDPYDYDFFWSRYSNLVNAHHGRDAWKMNYEKVLTGRGGGLYRLLTDVAAMIVEDYSGREISSRISTFWNSLSNDEKLETADEFLEEFGHMLPSEYTSGRGAYLKMNFPRILAQYPQLLMEIRKALR